MTELLKTLSIIVTVGLTIPALADSPDLQTPSPVIFLTDNLGEPDRLGWCIDTQGRGFGENLHAHSCKPQGGDVQFAYLADERLIISVAFSGKCMVRHAAGSDFTFGLVDCDANDPAQRFSIDEALGRIMPADAAELCVTVGEAIRKAGPFSSRDLILADCATTAEERMTWTVRGNEG